MYKQLTIAVVAVMMAFALVGSANAQTTVVTTHHFHNHFGFRNHLGLGILSQLENPCISIPGTIAVQTSAGVECVTVSSVGSGLLNGAYGTNIIIGGFGEHHFFHHNH